MRFWLRKPSIRWMMKSRVSPRRFIAHDLRVKNPYWAVTSVRKYNYNKIYHGTTFSVSWLIRSLFN